MGLGSVEKPVTSSSASHSSSCVPVLDSCEELCVGFVLFVKFPLRALEELILSSEKNLPPQPLVFSTNSYLFLHIVKMILQNNDKILPLHLVFDIIHIQLHNEIQHLHLQIPQMQLAIILLIILTTHTKNSHVYL